MVSVLDATLFRPEIIVGLDEALAGRLAASPRSRLTAVHDLRRRVEAPYLLTAQAKDLLARYGVARGRSSASSGHTGPPSS